MSETPLMRQIRAACNVIPGVRLARNNNGGAKTESLGWITFGLGEGSADLVGVCTVTMYAAQSLTPVNVGRVFCLEVKSPGGKTAARRRKTQAAWARIVRQCGGFCATVRSVDEALAAVTRCRNGESE